MFKGQIIGNLGADAQVKSINGIDYVSFDVAHSWKDGEKEQTIWVGCLSRGHKAVVPYLKRGTKVYVCGDLSARIYDSSHYHCKMIGYSLFVDTLQLCSPKQDESKQQNESKPQDDSKQDAQGGNVEDDNLPW